jgi:hypothetical protein
MQVILSTHQAEAEWWSQSSASLLLNLAYVSATVWMLDVPQRPLCLQAWFPGWHYCEEGPAQRLSGLWGCVHEEICDPRPFSSSLLLHCLWYKWTGSTMCCHHDVLPCHRPKTMGLADHGLWFCYNDPKLINTVSLRREKSFLSFILMFTVRPIDINILRKFCQNTLSHFEVSGLILNECQWQPSIFKVNAWYKARTSIS